MPVAPESYLETKRPPLNEALKLEGGTVIEATKSLEAKGYFTPAPRPWSLGFNDRGHGHRDWGVIDKFGDLVVRCPNKETAELIIVAVNNHKG
jgi:hypothetical protein